MSNKHGTDNQEEMRQSRAVKSGTIFTVTSLFMMGREARSLLLDWWVLSSSGAHYYEEDTENGQEDTHTIPNP